jgi:hypothetical protein
MKQPKRKLTPNPIIPNSQRNRTEAIFMARGEWRGMWRGQLSKGHFPNKGACEAWIERCNHENRYVK